MLSEAFPDQAGSDVRGFSLIREEIPDPWEQRARGKGIGRGGYLMMPASR